MRAKKPRYVALAAHLLAIALVTAGAFTCFVMLWASYRRLVESDWRPGSSLSPFSYITPGTLWLSVILMTAGWLVLELASSMRDAPGRRARKKRGGAKPHTSRGQADPKPPEFGCYLLYLFVAKKDRDPLLGDLEQEYREAYALFGEKRALVLFYKQVTASLWPSLPRKVMGWLGELFRWITR